jgi:UDP-N-acetyl-D-mannosaminuronate dehydrogenase
MNALVIGLGEIGRPLADLLDEEYEVERLDVEPTDFNGKFDVVHICYPYEIEDFVGTTVAYMERFEPELGIINSTVGVGTTRAIAGRCQVPVVNSPVRGKHHKMLQDLRHYTKYIGALEVEHGELAARHFANVGLTTRVMMPPEATELAKLTETTYFGLLISWAQEVERYCLELGLDYDDVVSIYDEIAFFPPVRYFPGAIGGHCVMPNIDILGEKFESPILQSIRWSNAQKIVLEEGGS